MEKTMEEFIHSADSRFASKDVEKLVYWILWLVFTGMTWTIIGFIYNATWLTK
jgi:sensor domain CHASE-containing protein